MPKPASYPYLTIAKKYDTPYADVLADAVYLNGMECKHHPLHNSYWRDMHRANVEFAAIRRGDIDWLTGETITK